MPLWKIYHPEDAFTAEDRQELARRITATYDRLPEFYVGVVFQAVGADSFFIGGEPRDNFVRIWVDHIARSLPTEELRTWWIGRCEEALAPFIRDRGLDWEFHIDETPFDFWSIQGYRPPKPDTEDDRRWKRENRPSPPTGA